MGCAKVFGDCISMRDEPADKPIPEEFQVSDYHIKAIEKTKGQISQIEGMNSENLEQKAQIAYQHSLDINSDGIMEKGELHNKYLEMLDCVDKWEPPTEDHVDLKKFMQQQIKDSIKHDCSTDYYTDQNVMLESGEEWKDKALKTLRASLEYHKTSHEEEVERIAGQNKWVKQLRESLN